MVGGQQYKKNDSSNVLPFHCWLGFGGFSKLTLNSGGAGRLRSLVRILGVILANVGMVFPGASKNLGLTNIFAFIITWM